MNVPGPDPQEESNPSPLSDIQGPETTERTPNRHMLPFIAIDKQGHFSLYVFLSKVSSYQFVFGAFFMKYYA